MIILFRVRTQNRFSFVNWTQWYMLDLNLSPKLKMAHFYDTKIETSLAYKEQLKLDQFTKMINIFRFGIQPPIF